MTLHQSLSQQYFLRHPKQAAEYMATLPDEDIIEIIENSDVDNILPALAAMDPFIAGRILSRVQIDRAQKLTSELNEVNLVPILRTLDSELRKSLIAKKSDKARKHLAKLLRFPKHTVGAWANPRLLQFKTHFTVRQTLDLIQEYPEQVGNVIIVIHEDGRFSSYVHAIDLYKHPKDITLKKLHKQNHGVLPSLLSLQGALNHPQWQHTQMMAVVDESENVIGGISFQRLQSAIKSTFPKTDAAPTGIDVYSVFTFYLAVLSRLAETFFSLLSTANRDTHK